MDAAAGPREAGPVPRVLVFWSRPHHLTVEEAERWAGAELEALLATSAIEHVRLARLASASARHAHACDWMLELELRAGTDVAACVESSGWKEWLGDLRLLGMRPVAMVTDGDAPLEGGRS
jgi:hypothetical protein